MSLGGLADGRWGSVLETFFLSIFHVRIYSICHLLFHFMKLPFEIFFPFLVLNLG